MNLQESIRRIIRELNYELIWYGKNDEGKNVWKFKKNDDEIELTEDTIEHFYRFNDEKIKKSLQESEILTNDMLKKHWIKHRTIDAMKK